MELDDFRRKWQQQPGPAAAWSGEEELEALVALGAGSPVSRMLHNARVEIMATAVSLSVSGAVLLLLGNAHRMLPFWVLLLATGLLSSYDYYSKQRLLRHLHPGNGALRSHVERQLQSLRGLLQLNYRFVMATLVLVSGFLVYFAYVHMPQLFQGNARTLWQRGLWLGLTLLASGIITHWLVRWQLQQQYGQHLDRLEAVLRELEA